MLPKRHRLTKKEDFQKVLKIGLVVHCKYFGLFMLPNQDSTRVGIIVSNKISKKSTERNRIRRILRKVCQDEWLNIKENCWFVFLVKTQASGAEAGLLRVETKKNLLKWFTS